MIGLVFGIVTIEVTPPASAALVRVLKFSLYSNPGSPTKAFMSTTPGIATFPFKSIFSENLEASEIFVFFPIDFIFPFSLIIILPISSIF